MGGKGSGGYRKNALPKDKNPLLMAKDPANVDPKVNSKVIRFMKAAMSIGDPDLSSPESIEEHFFKYLEVCDQCEVTPMIGSYAASMGMSHNQFWGVCNHDPRYKGLVAQRGLTAESIKAIQKSYDFLKISWEASLMDDKGNPVKWIFLGKNYFGMKDQSEKVNYNVEVPQALPKPEDVREKYAGMVGREVKGELLSVEDVDKEEG